MSYTTHSIIAQQALLRIDQVIDNVDCLWPVMGPEKDLLVVLREHVGKGNAITLHQLVELLGVSDRVVKAMVSNLRVNFRVMIGASRDAAAGGYYVISSAAEALESTQYLVSQVLTMLRVIRVMRGRHATVELFGQLHIQLKLDADPDPTPQQEEQHAPSL
jgi:hypothetical protein